MATRMCDICDIEVADNEEKCPKCGNSFAEMDELVSTLEQAESIREKRKKRATPAPAPAPTPEIKQTPKSRLLGLGRTIRGKHA